MRGPTKNLVVYSKINLSKPFFPVNEIKLLTQMQQNDLGQKFNVQQSHPNNHCLIKHLKIQQNKNNKFLKRSHSEK